nr:endonuclease/exonuclease/phosphatase family protein [Pseudomonas sp.]
MAKAELRGLLTGLAVVALGLLFLISFDVPIPGIAILQTLRFHIALPMLLLPVLLIVQGAGLRGMLLAAAVFLSIGEGVVDIYYQQKVRWGLDDRIDPNPIRILSYNVLAVNERPDDVVDFIIDTLPDIAVIMETPGIESSLDRLAEVFLYHAGCEDPLTCDLSIWSRTPLDGVQLDTLEFQRQRLISAETTIEGRRIAIVGAHLSKPYFDTAAWAEMWKLTHTLRKFGGPVVLAGDFNAAAWSADVRWFVARSGLVPPPFYPATWPVEAGPFGVPIDNMFTHGGALIQAIEAMPDPIGSNHRGLIATVGMPG